MSSVEQEHALAGRLAVRKIQLKNNKSPLPAALHLAFQHFLNQNRWPVISAKALTDERVLDCLQYPNPDLRMQGTDSLIEWSGTSRSTVGICEQFIHGVAVGHLIPPYSALFDRLIPPYSSSRPRALALRQGTTQPPYRVRESRSSQVFSNEADRRVTCGQPQMN